MSRIGVSPKESGVAGFALPGTASVREVGPRDGLQIEEPISVQARIDLLEALVATGVRRIEATSFVSQRLVPSMAGAEQVAGAALQRWPQVQWSALVAGLGGVRRALDTGVTSLEYVISAADAHSKANVGRTTDEAAGLVPQIAELVHAAGGHLEVIIATAWDCPFDGPTDPQRVLNLVRSSVSDGADSLCIADTIGTSTPGRVASLLGAVRERADGVRAGVDVGVHFHDTRGMGIANSLAALNAGVTSMDASIGGLGGCPFAPGASGNIATEELAWMLHSWGVETGLDLEATLAATAVAEAAVGHALPSRLARVGLPTRVERSPA